MLFMKQWWNRRLSRWLEKRIPDNKKFNLDMSNVFIFPSRFGVFYCLLAALLFILGTNYRNNLMLLLAYFLLSLFLVNLLVSYGNFSKLRVEFGKSKSVFAGADFPVALWLGEIKSQSSSHLNCHGKLHFKLWNESTQCSIEADNHANPVTVNVATSQRGFLKLPRITIESYYPLGLFRCWTHLRLKNEVLIYPKPVKSVIPDTWQREQTDSDAELSQRPGHTDFDSLSSYRPGEPLNHVAWKIMAKGGEMMTKKFSDSEHREVWLSLEDIPVTNLEEKISQLTWQVLELDKQQIQFGLQLADQKIAPATGNQHLEQCLTALACHPGISIRSPITQR